MRNATMLILLASMMSISTAASAAGEMKPGLWDMTMKSDAMKDVKMPKMTPEQLEQMKKMGIKLPDMHDGAMTVQVCMTKAMVERNEPPTRPQESGCQSKNMHRSGNSYSADIICDGPVLKGDGKATGTFTSSEVNSVYDFKGTSHGKPITMHHETTGKWVSADCGNVKPYAMPAK